MSKNFFHSGAIYIDRYRGPSASNTPQSILVSLSVYGSTSGTLAWSDSFETYPLGSFPSAWTPDANASDLSTNYVTNSIASSGSNSLRLYGVVGGSWAAITYRALGVTPTYRISFDVYNGTETLSGAHPYRAEVGIREGMSWVNPGRWLIYFDQYGNVKDTTGATITTYSTAQWYHIEIVYSRPDSATVSVSYTINGTTYPAVITAAQSSESSMTNVELSAQEGSPSCQDRSRVDSRRVQCVTVRDSRNPYSRKSCRLRTDRWLK